MTSVPVFALLVFSALCFSEQDRRMIHKEICVKFGYGYALPVASFSPEEQAPLKRAHLTI